MKDRRTGRRGRADRLERLDVLGMAAQRELDLGLLEHRVDTPASIGLAVLHGLEALERAREQLERFGGRPPLLRLLAGADRVVDRLLGLAAAAEVIREELHHVVEPAGVERLETEPGGHVVPAPAALEEPP